MSIANGLYTPKWCWILFAYTTFASKWNHLVDPLLSQLCNELGWGFSISLRIFFLGCWTEKNIQTKRTPLRLVLPCYRTQTFMLIGLSSSNFTPTGIKKKVEFLAGYASVPLGSMYDPHHLCHIARDYFATIFTNVNKNARNATSWFSIRSQKHLLVFRRRRKITNLKNILDFSFSFQNCLRECKNEF